MVKISRIEILKSISLERFKKLIHFRLLDSYVKNITKLYSSYDPEKDIIGDDLFYGAYVITMTGRHKPINYRINKKALNTIHNILICETDPLLLRALIKYSVLEKVIDYVERNFKGRNRNLDSMNLAEISYTGWFVFAHTKEGFFFWKETLLKVINEYNLYRINNLQRIFEWKKIKKKKFKTLEEIDWDYVSANLILPENLIMEFEYNVNWYYISLCQKLSVSFIRRFYDMVNWSNICIYQKMTEELIREFPDRVIWKYVVAFQNISADFKKEFAKYIEKADNCPF